MTPDARTVSRPRQTDCTRIARPHECEYPPAALQAILISTSLDRRLAARSRCWLILVRVGKDRGSGVGSREHGRLNGAVGKRLGRLDLLAESAIGEALDDNSTHDKVRRL